MTIHSKELIFTDAAKVKLEALQQDFNQRIEVCLKEENFVPGDEFIEITAGDVENIAKRVQIVTYRETSVPLKIVIPIMYAVLGLTLIGVGIFSKEISQLYYNDPKRLILIVSGVLIASVGYISLIYYRLHKSISRHEDRDHKSLPDPFHSHYSTSFKVHRKVHTHPTKV